MADRSQDSAFAKSLFAVVFPNVAEMAGAAWNFQPLPADAVRNATLRFGERLVQRGLLPCPANCTCNAAQQCGHDYQPLVMDQPVFEAGFIFGMSISTSVFLLIVVIQVRRCSRSSSSSGYTKIN